MDQKPQTRGSPKKTAKLKLKDEQQFERFLEAARTSGVEPDSDRFEAVFKHLALPKIALKPPKKNKICGRGLSRSTNLTKAAISHFRPWRAAEMAGKNTKNPHTIVDLFSGCGGFSLGAEMAGFTSLSAIDIDPTLQSGYRKNFPGSKVVQASVAEIDKSAWRHFIGNKRPDGVIGGPPCQGFSWIGKRQKDDPRNSLIHHFYRHVGLLKPKFFVMENVGGLLDAENIHVLRDAMEQVKSRYTVLEPFMVNAAHYGAATKRQRVVVFGYDPDEVDPITVDHLRPKASKTLLTVREAISDLPSPVGDSKDEIDFGWAEYPSRESSRLSSYAQRMRKKPKVGLGWDEAIQYNEKGFVSGLLTTVHSKEVAQRYNSTPGGKTDAKTKSYRLEWDGQCPTLRAGTGADKGAFQAVRPLHPGKGRVITVREAARLQGFPDWFVFHHTKWHSFRMIGNSVSPIVSHGLMKRISKKMHAALAR